MSIMLQKDYQAGRIKGWLGEDMAKYHWNLIKNSKSFKRFQLKNVVGAASRRMMLFDVTRKVLGKDTENYGQEIGDCCSFGMKNAIEYLMCCEILLNGENESYTKVFPPYIYGISRVDIGGNQLGDQDGSLGSWTADGVIKYGIINSEAQGCPPYSGSVAKAWGGSNGDQYLNKWKSLGQKHLVKTAAKIDTWSKLLNAICNGYPCTIASNQGFTMTPDASGFHEASGQWGHQMCVIGIDDEYSEPYVIILNSWGDVMGTLKDFKTGVKLPVGTIRAKKSVMEDMMNTGECFAISGLQGFPGRQDDIEKALFKLI